MRALCIAALFAAAASAASPYLVFTTRTHPRCPIAISSIAQSKETGFQAMTFHNDSEIAIHSVRLRVTFVADSKEEMAETADLSVMLDPRQDKRVDVGLGRIRELTQRAGSARFATVILFVDSIQFSDGTQWKSDEPVLMDSPDRNP